MSPAILLVIYIVVIFGFFFLVIILPERKRKKQFSEMMKNLKVNDEVVTRGGIIGKVINLQDNFIILQSGPDKARIKILKSAINNIVKKEIEQNK